METEASLDGLDGGEGTEENFQNDSLSEQACEGQMHGKEDIWSEEEDIEAPLCTQKTGGRSLRTHDLFFASEDEGRDFQSVLQEIQAVSYTHLRAHETVLDTGISFQRIQ